MSLSCMKFHCLDCNEETRTILNLELLARLTEMAQKQQQPDKQIISEVKKYEEYVEFCGPHKKHNSYSITITLSRNEDTNVITKFEEVAKQVVVD